MKTEPLYPMPGTTLEHLRPDQICDEPPALFSLSNAVATPAALALIEKHGASIPQLLNRHQTGDWQELCKEDRRQQLARAAFGGERVLLTSTSVAPTNPSKFGSSQSGTEATPRS